MPNPATGYPPQRVLRDPSRSFGAIYDVSGFCLDKDENLDLPVADANTRSPPEFSMEKHFYGLPQNKPWPKIGDACCKCNGGKYLGLSDMFGTDLDCDACGHHIFVCAKDLSEEAPKAPKKRIGTDSCGPR